MMDSPIYKINDEDLIYQMKESLMSFYGNYDYYDCIIEIGYDHYITT